MWSRDVLEVGSLVSSLTKLLNYSSSTYMICIYTKRMPENLAQRSTYEFEKKVSESAEQSTFCRDECESLGAL